MKLKNIVLLGFVTSAADYLKEQFTEAKEIEYLEELDNYDLEAIKKEMADKLDSSIGSLSATYSNLIKTGSEAFNSFIAEDKKNETFIDELKSMFDIDFDDEKYEEISFEDDQEPTKRSENEPVVDMLESETVESAEETPAVEETVAEEEPAADETLAAITKMLESYVSKSEPEQPVKEEDEYLRIIMEAAEKANEEEVNVDELFSEVVEGEQSKEESDEIDDIFNEIVSQENAPEETVAVEETAEEETADAAEEEIEEDEDLYVSSLIDELKKKLEEEEAVKETVDPKEDIYNQISDIYPYLSKGFIRSVYDLKEPLAKEYPLGKRVIVLHRLAFEDVSELRQFVEIVMNHDYVINVDEDKMIADILKEHVNTDGKILTNIFEIANQAKLLNGSYEGYKVVVRED